MTLDPLGKEARKREDDANNLEIAHAQKLADKIKAKWRERGCDNLKVWLEPGRKFVGVWRCVPYFVRSNLVNGLPPETARIPTEGNP